MHSGCALAPGHCRPRRAVRPEEQVVVFFHGQAADVQEHGVVRARPPRGAKRKMAALGPELARVDPPGKQGKVVEAHGRQLGAKLHGWDKCHQGAVVHPPQPGQGRTAQRRPAVQAGVGVEVRVEAGGDRYPEPACCAHGGSPQRSLRGHVDDVGAGGAPAAGEIAPSGQSQAQHGVSRDGKARHCDLGELRLPGHPGKITEAGPVYRHFMPPAAELAGDHPERHCDAVDLWRKGFGDKGNFHKAGGKLPPPPCPDL